MNFHTASLWTKRPGLTWYYNVINPAFGQSFIEEMTENCRSRKMPERGTTLTQDGGRSDNIITLPRSKRNGGQQYSGRRHKGYDKTVETTQQKAAVQLNDMVICGEE